MRLAWLAVFAVTWLATASPARADEPARLYAHFSSIDEGAVVEAAGFALPAGVGFTQVALARSRVGEQGTNGGLVLLRCRARTCAGRRVNLGAVDRIEVLGVVDLDGALVSLPARATAVSHVDPWTPLALLGDGRRPRWPVLVVRSVRAVVESATTRDGLEVQATAVETRLIMVSLRRRDQGRVVFDDALQATGANGAGIVRTFRLAHGTPGGLLDIAATEQRRGDRASACVPPPPVEYAYRWVGDRYQRADGPLAAGPCH